MEMSVVALLTSCEFCPSGRKTVKRRQGTARWKNLLHLKYKLREGGAFVYVPDISNVSPSFMMAVTP